MIHNPVYEIELAKSGRARCKCCRENILKKEPRGIGEGGFYCYKCVPNKLKVQINKTKKMEKEFKTLMEKSKKLMIFNRL